ncbi:AraC family transcriptional regulator [Gemmatimonadetes bacterium T265]|nr:AraC family transcriptional regulator [Gemmatimonadetes bacterium T265]
MRSTLEHVEADAGSSFRVFTPRLPGVFLWHYHPEYELAFIEGASGTRHVGDHVARYEGSDLVFVGPNVPHLNFDYGLAGAYRQVVVQLAPDFLGDALGSRPELAGIAALFARARAGVAFRGRTKAAAGRRLARLPGLPPFERLVVLLQVFQQLAAGAERGEATALGAGPLAHVHDPHTERQRLARVSRLVMEHYPRRIPLAEAADAASLSEAAFCRFFKRATGHTFTEFVNRYRVHEAQRRLLADDSATQAAFACGFESVAYFTRVFRRVTGENPLAFKRRHRAGATRG